MAKRREPPVRAGKTCKRGHEDLWYFTKRGTTMCAACSKEAGARRRIDKKDEIAVQKKKYRDEHLAERLAYNVKWKKANPEKTRASIKKWQQENPDKVAVHSNRHRLKKLGRPAFGLTAPQEAEIAAIYEASAAITEITHVDHIVPLNGDTVSGLHVPWNLQVLTRSENMDKKSKFDPADPLQGNIRGLKS